MRPIDADALMDALPVVTEDKQISLVGAVADFLMLIDDAPTVDAVPVVRCKDCKYFTETSHSYVCEMHSENPYQGSRCFEMQMLPSDFCSYGERKDND